MSGLSEIAVILKDMRPDMARMAGRKLSHQEKVLAAIEKAASLKYDIQSLMMEAADNRCNLSQSEEMADYVLVNLRGHLKDLRNGIE